MSLPGYQKNEDSGIAWLGEVPAHWKITKTKHVCTFTTGWTPPTGDSSAYEGENLWANISDLGDKLISDTAKRISDEAVCKAGIPLSKKGSLLFSFKLSIGQVAIVDRDMYTNEAIATFRESDELSVAYAYYAFPFFLVQNAAENIYGAKLLNQELIRSATLLLPPPEEQAAIATFLDREAAKIDALIGAQEKLLALLAEKRQAAISHAVTRGLNHDVPMKDSGVAWLGAVPSHWEMKRIKDCGCEIVDCKNRTPESHPEGEYFVVRTSCVRNGEFNPEEGFFTDEGNYVEWTKKGKPQPGDILFTREAPTGEACVAPENIDFCLGQRMMYIRPPAEILSSKFLLHSIYSGLVRERIESKSKGSTVGHLRVGEVGELPLLLPPIGEQQTIVSFLDTEITKLDALKAEAERAIALLKERRSALIAAAVTGKINVCDAEWPEEMVA